MFVQTQAVAEAVLTKAIGAGGPLNGAKVALYTAGPNPITPGSSLADFTLATFTGATPQTVTFGTVHYDPDGNAYVDSFNAFFITGGTTFETVKGYLLTDGAGTTLLLAEDFPTPIPMPAVGSACEFVSRYNDPTKPGGTVVVVP